MRSNLRLFEWSRRWSVRMKTTFIWRDRKLFVHVISMFRSFWDVERPSREWISRCSFHVDLNLCYEAKCSEIWTKVGIWVHGEVLCRSLTLPAVLVSSKVQPEPIISTFIKSLHLRPPHSSSPCQIHFKRGQWPRLFPWSGNLNQGNLLQQQKIDLGPLFTGALRRNAGLNESVIQFLICSYAGLCSKFFFWKSWEQCTSWPFYVILMFEFWMLFTSKYAWPLGLILLW